MTLDSKALEAARDAVLTAFEEDTANLNGLPEDDIKRLVATKVAQAAAAAYLSALPAGEVGELAALREALELTAGALQAGQRSMAPKVAFTGDWSHLGTRSVSDILDIADAALSRRATTGGGDE